jgi:hypothetical protein
LIADITEKLSINIEQKRTKLPNGILLPPEGFWVNTEAIELEMLCSELVVYQFFLIHPDKTRFWDPEPGLSVGEQRAKDPSHI